MSRSRREEWGDETPEARGNRLLAFQVIEEAESLRGHGIARWVVKYVFTAETYGIDELHPSTEYLCKKYNKESRGNCSVKTMQDEISWAKRSQFITTTGRGKNRTFELNLGFLTDRMAEVKGLQLKREIEREKTRLMLQREFGTQEETQELAQEEVQELVQEETQEFEGQNNRGNFAPNGSSSGRGKSNSSLREETAVQIVAGYKASTINGKLRIVDDKGKVCGGNPYVEKAYMLWEEIMGFPLKRSQWNSIAGRNMMIAKDKGEDWLRKTLKLCKEAKQDTKADFRARNIANLADLQKNWEYVIDWARQKAGVRSKPNVVDLNEFY